jgi:hypothetical protein
MWGLEAGINGLLIVSRTFYEHGIAPFLEIVQYIKRRLLGSVAVIDNQERR